MERQAQFIGPFRKRPGVQKPDRFYMIFSSTPNSYFKTKTNASSCCLLSFKQYLQVRINKMINGIDYHPSPSELISRIHPFRVLSIFWTFSQTFAGIIVTNLQICGVQIFTHASPQAKFFPRFLSSPQTEGNYSSLPGSVFLKIYSSH